MDHGQWAGATRKELTVLNAKSPWIRPSYPAPPAFPPKKMAHLSPRSQYYVYSYAPDTKKAVPSIPVQNLWQSVSQGSLLQGQRPQTGMQANRSSEFASEADCKVPHIPQIGHLQRSASSPNDISGSRVSSSGRSSSGNTSVDTNGFPKPRASPKQMRVPQSPHLKHIVGRGDESMKMAAALYGQRR